MDLVVGGFKVAGILTQAGFYAYELYKSYRNREGDLEEFAQFMHRVKQTVEGVTDKVPEFARPVAEKLETLVSFAFVKSRKYESRNIPQKLLHRITRSEEVRMQRIKQDIQQLMPLLIVSVVSATDATTAVEELQSRMESLQGSSKQAAEHLGKLQGAIEALTASSATLAEVEERMTAFHDSMVKLQGNSLQKVLEGCASLEDRLSQQLDNIVESVSKVSGTVVSCKEEILDSHSEMRDGITKVDSRLTTLIEVMMSRMSHEDAARVQRYGGIALEEIGTGSATQVLPSASDNPVELIVEAIKAGNIIITSCPVLHWPLMPEGPLRPVSLPCCGYVVSHAGAQYLIEQRQCQNCYKPLTKTSTLAENEVVAQSVANESHGFALRVFEIDAVTIGSDVGQGCEGAVKKAMVCEQSVAVKQVPLPHDYSAEVMAGLRLALMAAYNAGRGSLYVCSVYGYCWAQHEIWMIMELCDTNLEDFVAKVKKENDVDGLPPLDVVNLGLMMCSALHAVHHGARCLHLDVAPRNILLAAHGSSSAAAGTELYSARLSHFKLCKKLPAYISNPLQTASKLSLVQDVGEGTERYSPLEQLQGHGLRRSDVYSLGASMLFALTGSHPYPGEPVGNIVVKLYNNRPIQVPETVEPASLKNLLGSMLSIDVGSRPKLQNVQIQLREIRQGLQDAKPQFIPPA